MRSNLFALLLVAITWASPCFARIRPGFSLEHNTWTATDIILVMDDGKQRPKVTVVESWKGALHPGDTITISGLPAADAPRPQLDPDIAPFPDASDGGYIVFFLVHDHPADRLVDRWTGVAQDDKFLYTSAVFMRAHIAHRFSSRGNMNDFFPDHLEDSGPSDSQFRAQVDAVLRVQTDLQKAAAIASPDDRAKALLPIALGSYNCAQRESLELLGKCGQPAVPLLRGLKINGSKHCEGDWYSTRVDFEHDIASALSAADNPIRPDAPHPVIVDELAYWKKTAPILAVGWNKLPGADEPRAHYTHLLSALQTLKGKYTPPADDPLKHIGALWVAHPQLNDKSGPSEMIEACDAAYR